jgi:hypothetical protein
METYIINTSIGFVNDKKGDTFIEINDIEKNEENKKIDNFFMRKIKNLLTFKKLNKIDPDELV